jgi:hypothetical protein
VKHLAILVFVIGCGKSDKTGGADGSWTIGDITVPNSAIPQKLDVPTVLPIKIGGAALSGEMNEMAMVVPEKLNVSYEFGDPPNDDVVRGYRAMIYADPMPELTKKWGASTNKPNSSFEVSECWTAPEKKLEACVTKNSGQPHWVLTTVTTAPLPDRAATPVPPEPPGTYDDYPVGIGPCNVVGIEEVSQILGTQMQYFQPEPDDVACHLVPAIGKTASRVPGQVTASEAIAQVPDLLVGRHDAKRGGWTDYPIEGLGEKAVWDGKTVMFQVTDHIYRVSVTDAKKGFPVLKDRALQIARKVAARAQALPAE